MLVSQSATLLGISGGGSSSSSRVRSGRSCLRQPGIRNVTLMRNRVFSSSNNQRTEYGGGTGMRRKTSLPWRAAATKAKDVRRVHAVAPHSSWEEAAERLDLRTTASKPKISNWEDSGEVRTNTNDASGVWNESTASSIWTPDMMNDSQRNVGKTEAVEGKRFVDDMRKDLTRNRVTRGAPLKGVYERPNVRRWDRRDEWGRKAFKETATQSSVPEMIGEGIYGVGPVLAALSAERREFYTLYVQEGLDLSSNIKKKKDKKGFGKILRMAEKNGITIKEASKHDLNMIVDNRPHQGLVLDASPLEMVRIQELDPIPTRSQKGDLWVALDEVTDPQNLGAIIRSSYFFGVSGIVICAKNSAPLSGVVSKSSAGSLELMELRSCKNMMQFLVSSAENGWRVLGGSVSPKAVTLNKIVPGAPTILVLGNEGVGLRPLVERSCTHLVKIPGNMPLDVSAGDEDTERDDVDHHSSGEDSRSFLAVESLNVSVAAGVMLHHLIGVIDSSSQEEPISGSL